MKLLSVIAAVLFAANGFAQSTDQRFWFQFTDKENTPYSLDQPLEFLSQRALDRRERQHIPLLDNDLPVDPVYIQSVLGKGATYLTHSKWFNSISVSVPSSDVRDSILALPFVVGSLPLGKRPDQSENQGKFAPIQTQKAMAEELFDESDYGLGFNQIDMLGGVSLHDQGFRGEGMLIAILDAGFPNVDQFAAFDSLRNDNRIVGGWDFVAQTDTIFRNSSHGMSVLSTMAANLPGVLVGTAPKASYLLLRTEDAASESLIELDYWVAGAEFADSAGVDVINSSLGYTTFDNSTYDFSYADMDGNTTRGSRGADIAASKGILVVNSAGNSGGSAWQYIGAPADGDSVLAIGAVNSEGFIANFSSIGPSSDGDIKPNVCAQGYQAIVVNALGVVTGENGTSFSGPIMAGMSACLWQANLESATNMEVFHAIEASADRFTHPDKFYGYGIPNFAKANLMLSGITPNNVDKSELFPVFPNPFSDQFQGMFYSSGKQKVLVRLVNSLGQEIRKFEGTASDYSGVTFRFSGLQGLTEGLYTLQIDADSGTYYQKMVKVRD
ncbi:MAG: S8 family serine peptidase [Flavobacteriales bacterium]|nr:S8 family serine peptidase [Flavobacteriales bacterium]